MNTNEKMTKLRDKVISQATAVSLTPDAAARYSDELSLLRRTLAERCGAYDEDAAKSITMAVMTVSRERIASRRNDGWVCGTQVVNARKRFSEWLRAAFTDDELHELCQQCCAEEPDSPSLDFLSLLLHRAPQIVVHPRLRRIVDTE